MKKLIFVLCLALAPRAEAFQILSAVTSACHEFMTLGFLGYGPPDFQPSAAATTLSDRMIASVRATGVPTDASTRAMIKEMRSRFHWEGYDEETQFVLASLVAGARAPDTKGFSIIDINHIRGNHLTDSAQATHLLRMKVDDGDAGPPAAIARTRGQITALINGILSSWNSSGGAAGPMIRSERWTFPFYGEQSVQIFGPAYDLGQVAHSMEDSYAHALRDDSFHILTVLNYREQMRGDLEEDRDGAPHSERLDQCNTKDSFDSLRINEIHRQGVRVFTSIDTQLAASSTDDSPVETILDDVFAYTAGCDLSNRYCGSSWYAKSQEEISEPYRLGVNCGLVSAKFRGPNDREMTLMTILLALILPVVIARVLRQSTSRV